VPRRVRFAEPTYFHVFNRAIRKQLLFEDRKDYGAFLTSVRDAQARAPMALLAFCVMPNHFHLVVGPCKNAELSRFMHRLTVIHSKRWHKHHGTEGTGPVYQGRFKAVPVTSEQHFLTVCRYVEMNPVQAGLVAKPDEWSWSSLCGSRKDCDPIVISPWPISPPSGWEVSGNRVS